MGTGKLYNIGHISSAKISGGSITTSDLNLVANTISGLIDPTWPSSAANKHYVDNTSRMTFSISNIGMSANTEINLTRFDAGSNNVYVWQAAACGSGGIGISGLKIEILSGSTSVYSTSSATLQQGNPLATTSGGKTIIRFKNSGAGISNTVYGTGLMQISVY